MTNSAFYKFCTRPIEHTGQVSLTLAQQSRSLTVLIILTPQERRLKVSVKNPKTILYPIICEGSLKIPLSTVGAVTEEVHFAACSERMKKTDGDSCKPAITQVFT